MGKAKRHPLVYLLLSIGIVGTNAIGEERVSEEVMRADRALQQRIAELYRDGRNDYHAGNLTAAERELGECFSLYQQSLPYLLHPEKVAKVAGECEQTLRRVRSLQEFEAKAGGWRKRLQVLAFAQFEIRDADLSATMDYFQQRVGKAFGHTPPNFLYRLAPDKLKSKLTLELRNVTALEVLAAIESQMRIETKFEPHALVFVEAEEVEK
ncbi:MAG TPA: hypothetical protein VIS74_00070 [Chthoniobacterales bacterium]